MAGTRFTHVVLLAAAGSVIGLAARSASAAFQIIDLRSGQVGGLPGVAGQPDDIVTLLPNNPPGAPISAVPFTAADFAGAVSGPVAHVINPHPAWTPGLTDPLARWINFDGMYSNPDGTPGTGYGNPGSSLYAVPFFITLGSITSATITLEYAVDDWLGDWPGAGGNPDGLYINGVSTGHQGAGYASSSFHFQNITSFVTPGQNYLYFYQRDAGVLVSGLIFSARITVLPAPGPIALAGLAGLAALPRRRRR